MNNAVSSYLITSNVPEDVDKKIWDVKQKYNLFVDEQTPPDCLITFNVGHITLKSRFFLQDESREQEMLQGLDKIEKKSFEITADEATLFKSQKVGNVVVALVPKTDAIQKLHEDVLKAVFPFVNETSPFEGAPYKPHISISYFVPEEQQNEVLEYTKQHVLPIKYTLNNLYILKKISDSTKARSILKKWEF